MSKRCGKPGMPPSPNQKIVLDSLADLIEKLRGERNKILGVSIDTLTEYLRVNKIGGGHWGSGGEWKPWARSTVRDHLNDLFLKDLLVKVFVGNTAYYRPKL